MYYSILLVFSQVFYSFFFYTFCMYVSLLDRWFVIKEMSHLSQKEKKRKKIVYIEKKMRKRNIKFTSLFQSVRKVTHNNMIVWISVPPIIPDHIPCYIYIYNHKIETIFSISKSNCFPINEWWILHTHTHDNIKHYFANSILIRFL